MFCCVSGGSVEAAGGELLDRQQRHAVLLLGRAKVWSLWIFLFFGHFYLKRFLWTEVCSMQEHAKIWYDLCPRHMKDKQFWTVYFLLARSYILS
jgi:hypothetical protein